MNVSISFPPESGRGPLSHHTVGANIRSPAGESSRPEVFDVGGENVLPHSHRVGRTGSTVCCGTPILSEVPGQQAQEVLLRPPDAPLEM